VRTGADATADTNRRLLPHFVESLRPLRPAMGETANTNDRDGAFYLRLAADRVLRPRRHGRLATRDFWRRRDETLLRQQLSRTPRPAVVLKQTVISEDRMRS
jgi:hypothetical protein